MALITEFEKQQRLRRKFVSRQQFLTRCIEDITSDFHKQYGQFEEEWEATLDACELFLQQIDEYLCTRDLVTYECQILFGLLEKAETKYCRTKTNKRCRYILGELYVNDIDALREFDEDIDSIRSVYRMIALQEEC